MVFYSYSYFDSRCVFWGGRDMSMDIGIIKNKSTINKQGQL